MRGITEEKLLKLRKKYKSNIVYKLIDYLIKECTELNAWQPIETAPKDREILVYAPPYQDLKSLTKIIAYHDSAGYCIDELRYPTHWQELPDDPQNDNATQNTN